MAIPLPSSILQPEIRRLLLCLTLCVAAAGTTGRGQSSAASGNSVSNGTAARRAATADEKWRMASLADLLKAAEAGEAPAQYWYWAKLSQQADDEQTRHQTNPIYWVWWHEKSQKERNAESAGWANAKEEDLEKGAASGNMAAQIFLDWGKVKQALGRANDALPGLEKSAEQGFFRAEYAVAERCLGWSGASTNEINQTKGLELLQRAADHGWFPALYELGGYYLAGELLPPDTAKAIEYLQKAADHGIPGAQYQLARLYANGEGEPRSAEDTPLALLRKSAKSGWNLALEALADRYRTGLGVPMDYVRASRYYEAARLADQNLYKEGDSGAGDVFKLLDEHLEPLRAAPAGLSHSSNPPASGGVGSFPSSAPATDFYGFAKILGIYLKATERKDPAAMRQIGEWYRDGRFVPKEPAEACRWFSRAADFGDPDAAANRDKLKAARPPGQTAQPGELDGP